MKVIDRLKLELAHQEYFTDEEYTIFLNEQGLDPDYEYSKETFQKQLLFTVLDVLEAVANDVDTMSTISTEFNNISQAYAFIESRINSIRDRIAAIPEPEDNYSCFTLMYSNGNEATVVERNKIIKRKTLDEILAQKGFTRDDLQG